MDEHYVYIVECADGTLYTGYAKDVKARIAKHNTGNGAKYTRNRRPVRLMHSEVYKTKSEALKREHEIKRLTRHQKLALIRRDASETIYHRHATR
ncbi:GIY-YIG nuclease family protein [Salinicoccus hispanicus]|uniref:GIY-YIG nuclease family protein n=1 Tax=Salinicoccus hispanicus TaxID=157225 RepID=A0A6N8U4Z5_9STAP|nr:GIY-YIG nuclease family protein [Salinicoccus hispanicus]MXQ51555.1 GIY-YIG nuclease family protein [Salinicoccus hispanicus]